MLTSNAGLSYVLYTFLATSQLSDGPSPGFRDQVVRFSLSLNGRSLCTGAVVEILEYPPWRFRKDYGVYGPIIRESSQAVDKFGKLTSHIAET